MAKSVLQFSNSTCYLCGARDGERFQSMHWHHVFGGPNRKHSEKYGLKVRLCAYSCHEYGPFAVHRNKEIDTWLKKTAQEEFEKTHSREEFMKIFGKNWLWDGPAGEKPPVAINRASGITSR